MYICIYADKYLQQVFSSGRTTEVDPSDRPPFDYSIGQRDRKVVHFYIETRELDQEIGPYFANVNS